MGNIREVKVVSELDFDLLEHWVLSCNTESGVSSALLNETIKYYIKINAKKNHKK